MRLFFAIALPDTVRSALATLRFQSPDYRWVNPDLLHLTLVFLGEQPESVLPDLAAAAVRVAPAHRPLALRLDAPGQFGPRAAPRVLWVGVGGDLAPLHALQAALADAFSPVVRLTETQAFAPHLTLARRRRSATSGTAVPWPPRHPLEPLPIPCHSFRLVESVLAQSGPSYTPLTQFPLG